VSSTFQVLFDGTPADEDFYNALISLEVEENIDLPGAIQMKLTVNRTDDGDLDFPNDSRIGPLAKVAVVAQFGGGSQECIFDGVVLSHKLHLETAISSSTLEVWGQDASWQMNMEEKVKEWVNMTDSDVANAIFGDYGFDPAGENTDEDSPSHTEDGHTLMQRGTDIQFLRGLARRNGKVCRVYCADQPGSYTGFFAAPKVDEDPALTLNLNDLVAATVTSLDLEWDATRPTEVQCGQALLDDDNPDAAETDVTDSGLTLLADRDLATFTGQSMSVLLTVPVDDQGELEDRATSLLRDAGWFARCHGQVDVTMGGGIMRANTIVQVDTIGSLFSGKYLVWSVRHTISSDAHLMRFVLVRNAVGGESGAAGGAGALGGALASAVGL
jgi:phage protein D